MLYHFFLKYKCNQLEGGEKHTKKLQFGSIETVQEQQLQIPVLLSLLCQFSQDSKCP